MVPTRLFVYGTLKRGFGAEIHLRDATYIGERTTGNGYALYDLGDYPALVAADEGCVKGELYLVSAAHLERLDLYEGCPALYSRRNIELCDGTVAEAYVLRVSLLAGCPRIAGGSWTGRERGSPITRPKNG